MPDRKYTVMVDSWGAGPSFQKGMTLTIGQDKDDNDVIILDDGRKMPFPYDLNWAMANGVVKMVAEGDKDEEAANAQAVVAAMFGPGTTTGMNSTLPPGDAGRPVDRTPNPPEGDDTGSSPAEGMVSAEPERPEPKRK